MRFADILAVAAQGGGGAPAFAGPFTTYNPADKSAATTLSNGDLTAATAGGGWEGVRSTLSRTGKRYFEILVTTNAGATSVGVANTTASFATYIGADTNGVILYGGNGQVLYNGAALASLTLPSNGDVIGVAFDQAGALIWFSRNGTWMAGDPGAGTGGLSVPGIGAAPYIAMSDNTAGTVTMRALAASFTGTIPTGFAAWDS